MRWEAAPGSNVTFQVRAPDEPQYNSVLMLTFVTSSLGSKQLDSGQNLGTPTIFISTFRSQLAVPKGRRDCDFSANAGADACLDGGCNGGLICDPSNGTVSFLDVLPMCIPYIRQFVGPATLAEFTLDADGVDYYDGSFFFMLNGAGIQVTHCACTAVDQSRSSTDSTCP